jgi:hypothetical protein
MNWKNELRKEEEDKDIDIDSLFGDKPKKDRVISNVEYMIDDIQDYCEKISMSAEDVKNSKVLASVLNDLVDVLRTLKEADIE